MVVVALLMAAVAMLSLSFLTVLRSSQKENQGSRESLAALYACEAGLTAAVDDLVRGGTGTLGTKNQPVAQGSQRYWVQATDIGDGRIALLSYGREDRAQMGVEMVVQPSANGFFRWAAFGDEILHLDSNARADSYDSTVAPYFADNGSGSNAYDETDGDIGSNGNITIDSNIGVWGDAHPGVSGTVSGSHPENIFGATTPLPEPVDLPDIVVPAASSPGDAKTVSGPETLAAGTYRYTTLQINNNRVLTINGPATIVCDNLRLRAGANLLVNADDGPVEFFVIDDFVLNSNTTIASTEQRPADVAFNLLSDNILDPGVDVSFDEDLVDFDSGSVMYGTIYAPSAEITIDSNFELFGSVVARRIDLDSNCRIHYDESLAQLNDGSEVSYDTLSWRVVAQP
jgi:hypothetical protein